MTVPYCRWEDTPRVPREMLAMLSRSAAQYLEFPFAAIDYQLIADQLLELSGAAFVLINSYDETTRQTTTRGLAGSRDVLAKAIELLGFDPVGKSWPVNEKSMNQRSSGRLTRIDSLGELILSQVPVEICQQVEKLARPGDTYSIDLVQQGRFLGSVIILMPLGRELAEPEIIEVFARQVAATFLRYRVEKALWESEQRYRSLVEHSRDAIFVVAPGGRFIEANPSACRLLGYERAELIQLRMLDITPPEYLEAGIAMFGKLVEQGFVFGEMTLKAKDGREVPSEINAAVLPDGNYLGTVRDITERKQAENALRCSERKFRELFNNANDVIVLLELTEDGTPGRFIEVNDVACQRMGRSREEFLAMSPLDFNVMERDNLTKIVQDLLAQGHATFEVTFLSQNGWRKPYEISSHVFALNGKKVVLSIGRDITERRQAEEALRESEEQYRRLIELSPDAIMIHSEGKVVFSNAAAARIANVASAQEYIGKQVMSFLHPDYWEMAKERIQKILEERKIAPFIEEKFIRPDGTIVDMEVAGIPFTYRGKPAVQVVARDISERKRIENELLQASKLESLGILAGGIAHDFNNILTIILGNLSLGKMYASHEDPIHERLTEIEKAALQARDLTQQLLTFAKGGAPVKKTVSIGDLVKETTVFALRGSKVRCEFHIPEDLSPVKIDEGQISQVINNLVINAVQAMPEGGTIRVLAANITIKEARAEDGPLKAGRYIKISIADEGMGIPVEYRHKIFDPYFTTKPNGSGLGLATSYSIVKKHDGYIFVESEVGVGTAFHVFLPACTRRAVKKKDEETLHVGKGNILVMDDKETIGDIVGQMLARLGYKAQFARDGAEAIELYERAAESGHPFDCVVMDLTIPGGMGGKETIKKLREIDPDAKAIVSSGYCNDAVMANFREYGFDGVVAKPYRIEELSKVLKEAIRGTGR